MWEPIDPKDLSLVKTLNPSTRVGVYLACTRSGPLLKGVHFEDFIGFLWKCKQLCDPSLWYAASGDDLRLCPELQLCLKANNECRHNLREAVMQAGCYFASLIDRYLQNNTDLSSKFWRKCMTLDLFALSFLFPLYLTYSNFPLPVFFIPLVLKISSFLTASFYFSLTLFLYLNEASPPQWPKEEEYDESSAPGTNCSVPWGRQHYFLI